MIFATDYLIYITLFLIFVFAIKGGIKEKKALIITLITFPILVLLIKITHIFIVQQRPFVEYDILPLVAPLKDTSFPSRHASIMFTIAISYIFYKSKWSPLLLFLATWVGISRIYVGVHYPIDMAGGVAFGFLSVLISWKIKKLLVRGFFS